MDNNKRIIIIAGLLCVCLISFGVYGLCSRRGETTQYGTKAAETGSESAVERYSRGAQEEKKAGDSDAGRSDASSSNKIAGHYKDLERVNMPAGTVSQEKAYEGFLVSFNKENRTPNWVGWELLGTETSGSASRSNKFWQDIELEGCPASSDYTRSGYDRGHMCPAADQKWSARAMEDCFSMANMTPQDHALNTGAWNTLENKERVWARRDSAIVVIAGPIYEKNDNKRIGNAEVRVPGAFFKALLAPYCPTPRAIAFVFPNMSAPGNMASYAMSIRDLEKLTGFDFFSALPDDIEESVESTFSFHDWND